ncbi:MAG TPA: hypothetical protein VHS06_09955 [Chloroflexota bacterium]|nr:hypothetical protein [Chloroflexota bacterium]
MTRAITLFFATLVICLALFSHSAVASREFPETGYSITNSKILDYYDHRGGARVFGSPISREFQLAGTQVQLFQKAAIQIQANGGAGLLDIMNESWFPFTHYNGSTFPAVDPHMIAVAPSPIDPDYAERSVDFARYFAPDLWRGEETNFFKTMFGTVTYEEAFPDGETSADLLPLVNLEVWGLPISKPAYDPSNGNFLYLRFMRGMMLYDKTTGVTQALPVGEYFKALLTGQGAPADLARDAQASKLYRQYDNGAMNGLARLAEMPATNIFAAFEKDGVVVPTPMPPTPTPLPPTATPIPTATSVPVAAAATQAPAAAGVPAGANAQPPATITIVGDASFTRRVNDALSLLAEKSPYTYSIVKQNVFRIERSDNSYPTSDLPNRTFKLNDGTIWYSDWGSKPENETQWFASLLVHNAVHVSQYFRGAATTGAEAEKEALMAQRDALAGIETTDPKGQFWTYVNEALNDNTGWFGDWQNPRDPK